MLYGAAIRDGAIRSMDDPVTRYLPALRGSVYEGVTLRQLLQMSSGVAWNESYTDPNSDVARLGRVGGGGIDSLLAYMGRLPKAAPPGTRYNYSTGETHIAGAVLHAAVRRPLSQYLSEKIWRPAGMEADAHWMLLRRGDLEHGGCCLSATLRDYGRLGLLALRDGVAQDGKRLLAPGWMAVSTSPLARSRRGVLRQRDLRPARLRRSRPQGGGRDPEHLARRHGKGALGPSHGVPGGRGARRGAGGGRGAVINAGGRGVHLLEVWASYRTR
jgi:CubicO group peptidase (beta-lactamase class C family)